MEKSTLKRRTFLTPKDSIKFATQKYDIDAKYNQLSINERHNIMRNAMQKSMIASNEYEFRSLVSKDLDQATRGHWVEWHKKFTLSLACLLFFFIGAPLGAIIRKGGLGVPVVISVVIFIFYYIVNASGDKMAKSGEWVVWFGEWLSTMVLLPLGAFLTYKANKDSAVFNIEAYIQVIRRILGLRVSRNVTRKEVIIYDPDYAKVCQDISLLIKDWNNYEQKVRLRFPPHYIRLFFYKIDDQEVSVLNERMEEIISTLCNSRDAMILASINKIPVLATHAHTRPFHNYKWNMVLGVIFPLGVFFYFRIWNYRIRLYKDIKQIQKNFDFINERIDKILDKK
jgi:lipopolysaccharide export system permease protein